MHLLQNLNGVPYARLRVYSARSTRPIASMQCEASKVSATLHIHVGIVHCLKYFMQPVVALLEVSNVVLDMSVIQPQFERF